MNSISDIFQSAVQHLQAGQVSDAEPLLQQILRIEPHQIDVLHLLGIALFQLGRNEEAAEHIRRATTLSPTSAQLHHNLGLVLSAQGKLEEASSSFRQSLLLDPDDASVHAKLADLLDRQGNFGGAVASYERALQIAPKDASVLNRLGVVLQKLKQFERAADCYRKAIHLRPELHQAHNNLGYALEQLGNLDEAIKSYHTALSLKPDYAGALTNLGNARKSQGDIDGAIACHRQALGYQPDFVEALANLGNAMMDQGQQAEAITYYERALRIAPNNARAHMNLGIALLLTGQFELGWSEYEWRIQEKSLLQFNKPIWDGSRLAGRRILLLAEQGLGDAIQFIRYVPLVKAHGGHVIVACSRLLMPLFETCNGIDEIVEETSTKGLPLPEFDVYLHLLSVPNVLRTTLDSIPNNVPYLHADPSKVVQWTQKLHRVSQRNIGIVWQGNPRNPIDRRRSFSLNELEPVSRVPGIRLISLQKGEGSEQVHSPSIRFKVMDLNHNQEGAIGPFLDSFLDTAAIMAHLDLVITADTSVAHLAGALGVPVWLALYHPPDWRWMLDRDDTPWYPTMRIFRQKTPGDWVSVFRQIADELSRLKECPITK